VESDIFRSLLLGPQFAQDGKVKTGIGQFKPKGVLPVNAPAHSIGRLSIGEVLTELHKGDESQAPRRFAVVTDLR
jgi:hypothetical protein